MSIHTILSFTFNFIHLDGWLAAWPQQRYRLIGEAVLMRIASPNADGMLQTRLHDVSRSRLVRIRRQLQGDKIQNNCPI